MRTPTFRHLLPSVCACTLAFLLAGCGPSTPNTGDSVTIGLLLPFTGADSATTSNFERAALFAAARVNEGGGIGGKRLRIVSEDTHSEVAASRRSAQRLIDAGAKVVVGAESAVIGPEIYPLLLNNQVALLSPLVGAAEEPNFDCTVPWFRLAPSAKSMGEALAKTMLANGITDVAILSASDAYNEALSRATRERFISLGGHVSLDLKIAPGAQSYASEAKAASAAHVSAVVLATSARAGALVVNDFHAVLPGSVNWFLSPLLKTELLIANVAPGALDGARGVAPKIYETTSGFPAAFAASWQGDQPLEGAYFFYDAIALLAFAMENAAAADSTGGASAAGGLSRLVSSIRSSAAPTGEGRGWDEVESGLERIRNGDLIYYTGLTGPMLLTDCGSRKFGRSTPFEVENGQIVDVSE